MSQDDLFKNYLGTEDQTIDGIPSWLYYPFFIGSILSLGTILWSVLKTPEIPPTDKEFEEIQASRDLSFIKKAIEPFVDIYQAIKHMPKFMWKLAAVYLFQWYALFIYFQFIAPMFELTLGFDKSDALAQSSKMNLTYNLVTMIVALILVPIAARVGNKLVYMMGLFGAGIALLSIPHIQNENLVLLPMILMGIGWAAMMGIPYSMVSKIVPQEKRGVYMGILNMMIVVPMFIETITFGPIIKYLLGNNAVNAIMFAGVFFIISSILAIRLNVKKEDNNATTNIPKGGGH